MPRRRGIVATCAPRRSPGTARSPARRASRHASASCSSRSSDLRETPGSDGTGSSRRVAVEHEHRIDEVVGGKPRLAHHPAREIVAAHPARARVAGNFPVNAKPMQPCVEVACMSESQHAIECSHEPRNFAAHAGHSIADGERLPLSSLSGCPLSVRSGCGRSRGPASLPLIAGPFLCPATRAPVASCRRAHVAWASRDAAIARVGSLDAAARASPRTDQRRRRGACAANTRCRCARDRRDALRAARARFSLSALVARISTGRPTARSRRAAPSRAPSGRAAHRRPARAPTSVGRVVTYCQRNSCQSRLTPSAPPRSRSPAGRRRARRGAARRS